MQKFNKNSVLHSLAEENIIHRALQDGNFVKRKRCAANKAFAKATFVFLWSDKAAKNSRNPLRLQLKEKESKTSALSRLHKKERKNIAKTEGIW